MVPVVALVGAAAVVAFPVAVMGLPVDHPDMDWPEESDIAVAFHRTAALESEMPVAY